MLRIKLKNNLPTSVAFEPEGKESFELKRGIDWNYFCAEKTDAKSIQLRNIISTQRLERPEQQLMRSIMLARYGRCAISGCDLAECLDAAHILPVANGGKEVLSNMILLRTDLHRLFDAGLWSLKLVDGKCKIYAARRVASYLASASDGGPDQMNIDWVSKSVWLQARHDIQSSTEHVLVSG